MTWRYTDNTKLVVVRDLETGEQESCLVTRADVQEWIAQGNEPEDAQ